MELFKDYDYEIFYHPRKANIVVHALSRRSAFVVAMMVQEWRLLERIGELSISSSRELLMINCVYMKIQSELLDQIRA